MSDFGPLPDLPNELLDSLARAEDDLFFFSKFFFPNAFRNPWNKLQREIIDAIQSGHQKIVIKAPRGIGKTTIVRARAAQQILFQKRNFVSWLGKSKDFAVLQTENLKRWLVQQMMVRRVFGRVKMQAQDAEFEETFSKSSWVTSWGTLVFPRGQGQAVRGLIFDDRRIDLPIFDDLEDRKEIKSEVTRQEIKDWFHGDAMEAVPQDDESWQVLYIDTLKHEDSLLADLLRSSGWTAVSIAACTQSFVSRDSAWRTTEHWKKKYEEMRELGQGDTFFREFVGEAIDTSDRAFDEKNFRYFDEMRDPFGTQKLKVAEAENVVKVVDARTLVNVTIVDPAKTAKPTSAKSAVLGIGLDIETPRIYVRYVRSGFLHPDEFYELIHEVNELNGSEFLGVEETSLHEYISQPLQVFLADNDSDVVYVPLKADKEKELRAAGLIPYYRRKQVFHSRAETHSLEGALKMFPRPKYFDEIDCLAYAPRMMKNIEVLLGMRKERPRPTIESVYENALRPRLAV